MTFSTPENFWYSGGVWDGSWLDWTWLNIAPDLRRRLGVTGPQTDEEAARSWDQNGAAARRYRPMLELPDFKGVAPWYYEWMRHPPGDAWWSFARLPGRYERVSAAVLNLSGWFDEMYGPSGAVENFEGAGDALVLGPWTHGVGRRCSARKAGDRDFGPSAALDYVGTVLDWMDRHVKGVDSAKAEPAVRVFVMGSNRWRSADRWPFPGTRADTLYLDGPARGGKTGRLVKRAPSAPGGETVIRSDPAHPVTDPFEGRFGAHDYRALVAGPSVAVFETAPFASAGGDHRPSGGRAGGERIGAGLRPVGAALRRGAGRDRVEPLDARHGAPARELSRRRAGAAAGEAGRDGAAQDGPAGDGEPVPRGAPAAGGHHAGVRAAVLGQSADRRAGVRERQRARGGDPDRARVSRIVLPVVEAFTPPRSAGADPGTILPTDTSRIPGP